MAELRVALVTGATAGIGLETARGLVRDGFHVILTGRDAKRLDTAAHSLANDGGADRVETAVADFASLADVRCLAETILTRHSRLDVLVNNAGLISREFSTSADGYEMTFAVNHLAPFLLTNLLLDRLRGSTPARPPARIVNVASAAHKGARIDLRGLAKGEDWTPLKAYGRSKLCNILFTRALARRLDPAQVVTACLHPGVVATKIGDRAGTIAGWGWRLIKPFLVTPEKGAATSVFLATTSDATPYHGAYLIDRKTAQPDPTALDDALGERLWAESASLVGLPHG